MILKVSNNIGVNQRNLVNIEVESTNIILSSLIIYLMPILNMIIGFFVGKWFGIKYYLLILEIFGIFGTVLFLLSYFLLKYINSKLKNNNKINPKIVKIHNNSRYIN